MNTQIYWTTLIGLLSIIIIIIIDLKNKSKNKLLAFSLCICIGILIYIFCSYNFNNNKKPIVWKDKAFEKMMQKALNKEGEDIYSKQLENINTLYIIGDKIAYIDKSTDEVDFEPQYCKEGTIGYCKFKLVEEEGEAKRYDKKGNIVSLEDIKYFTNLRELYIILNKIEDMSPLKDCPNLEILILDLNEIHEIKIPSYFTNLKKLSLANNKIEDVSPLQSETLVKLEALYLYNNEISDISCFEKLVNRNNISLIDLGYNKISDIPNFEEYTSLRTLGFTSNFISNIENLSKVQSIKQLNLNYNNISTIDSIKLLDLKELNLYQNRLIQFPKDFKNKDCELDIRYNFIKDKTPLKEFKNLKSDFKLFDVEVVPNSGINPGIIIVKINNLHSLVSANFRWDTKASVPINQEEFKLEPPSEVGIHNLYIKATDKFGNETDGIVGPDGSSGWVKFSYTIQEQ